MKVKFRSSVRKDVVGETGRNSKADLGDFGVEGEIMRTDMGVNFRLKQLYIITVKKPFVLAWKIPRTSQMLKPSIANVIWFDSLKPWKASERFVTRSKIISEIRRYLDGQVTLAETPVLHNEAGQWC